MKDDRFVEACAMLPMLHVPTGSACVLCAGPFAETLAADVLRWQDVHRVLLHEAPQHLRDRRIEVIRDAPVGTCQAVLVSPDTDPEPYISALAPRGVLSASTGYLDRVAPFYANLRGLFSSIVPWREHLPGPLYGALASPGGKPVRYRQPRQSAKRINRQFIASLFLFGSDEIPSVFGRRDLPGPATKALPPPTVQVL